MERSNHRRLSIGALLASLIIGGGGLTAMSLFILLGAPGWIDCGWSLSGDLLWNTFLSLVFFVQHSSMIRPGVRKRMQRWVPGDYAKALYSIVSGFVLLAVVLLWQPADEVLFAFSGVGRWFTHFLVAAALAGFVWTVKSLENFDPLGMEAMLIRLGKSRPAPMPLSVRGPYRLVRHPFYFFTIVMIWSFPVITLDRLMFNGTWTAWIWIGAVLEERDLLDQYGDAYEAYRQTVPRLLPFRWR